MTTSAPIAIVIADDHPIFRDGLLRLLEAETDFRVVGSATDGYEAVTLVRSLHLLAMAFFVGGQLFLVAAVVPRFVGNPNPHLSSPPQRRREGAQPLLSRLLFGWGR